MSYHLRKLAGGGLIEEDVERGTRRDRWWRVTHQSLYHDPAESTAESADATIYLQALLIAYGDTLRRYAADVPHLPPAWFNVTMASDRPLRLTPEQLTELKRDLVSVIDRYRDLVGEAEDPAARSVSVQLHTLPHPE